MPYCITHDLSVHLSFKFQMHSEMIMMITDWLPYVSSSIFMDYSVRCAYSKKYFMLHLIITLKVLRRTPIPSKYHHYYNLCMHGRPWSFFVIENYATWYLSLL